MKILITKAYIITFMILFFLTILSGIAWLFDCKPSSLFKLWNFVLVSLIVQTPFQLLFGAKITFK